MSRDETLLEMARRHVSEGEERVRRQRELIHHLETTCSPLAEEARVLHAVFTASLKGSATHLAQIEAEQRSGRRDTSGDLLPLAR